MGWISRVKRNIRWIEKYCVIPEGRFVGQPVRLRRWQRQIILDIYGSPTRRYILSVGRKNAKTALAAFLCLLHTCGPEAQVNSQLYSTAQSREQAATLFELMAKCIRLSSELHEVLGIRDHAKEVYCPELGTLFKALSAEHKTSFGKSPVFVVHDELGQVRGPRFPLYSAMETAGGAHEEPMSLIISTQAAEDGDLLSILIDDALGGHDPKTKIRIWSSPTDSDPFSEEAILAANPAYGDFLNPVVIQETAFAARRMPALEAEYRNLHLNQRIAAESPFIPEATWKENGAEPIEEDFENPVYMGLDLSRRTDLTALVYMAKGEDGCYSVRCEFFAPQDGVADRSTRDRVPYDLWAQQGYLTLTPGKTVGYDFVAKRLIELCDQYHVREVRFDRWRIDEFKKELQELGVEDLPLVEHGQGFKDMTPSLELIEAELISGRIRHGNNPILTYCAANAVVTTDAADGRKLDKKKATGRIDGMVALVMAARGAVKPEEQGSVYNQRGIRTLWAS